MSCLEKPQKPRPERLVKPRFIHSYGVDGIGESKFSHRFVPYNLRHSEFDSEQEFSPPQADSELHIHYFRYDSVLRLSTTIDYHSSIALLRLSLSYLAQIVALIYGTPRHAMAPLPAAASQARPKSSYRSPRPTFTIVTLLLLASLVEESLPFPYLIHDVSALEIQLPLNRHPVCGVSVSRTRT